MNADILKEVNANKARVLIKSAGLRKKRRAGTNYAICLRYELSRHIRHIGNYRKIGQQFSDQNKKVISKVHRGKLIAFLFLCHQKGGFFVVF